MNQPNDMVPKNDRQLSETERPVCPECGSTNLWKPRRRAVKTWHCIGCGKKSSKMIMRKTFLPRAKKRRVKDMQIITREEVTHIIKNIKEPKARALAAVLYLSGARITEIVGEKEYDEGVRSLIAYAIPPLIKKEVTYAEHNGVSFIVLRNVQVLKQRSKVLRSVPIPIGKEKELVVLLEEYVKGVVGLDTPLFGFGRNMAHRIIKKHTGFFPHYFRHLRASHLVTDYDFKEGQLKEFFKTKDPKWADWYVHLSITDVMNKMCD